MGNKILKFGFAAALVVGMMLAVGRDGSFVAMATQIGEVRPPLNRLADVQLSCTKESSKDTAKCDACKGEIKKHLGRLNERANRAITEDSRIIAGAAACGDDSGTGQQGHFVHSGTRYACSGQSQRAREAIARELAKDAKACSADLKEKCAGIGGTDQNKAKDAEKACKEMEKKANNAGNERGNEAKKMDENANKSKDDGKKEQSAGGMPQMPQIPQQQGGDESPQQQADYPQATSPTPGSGESKPPEIETAKFDEDKDKTAVPTVGFGNTTPTDVATVTAPGNSFSAQGIDPNLRGLASNSFGDKAEGGAVAATASPPGGSGSGSLNSSGASLPGGGQQGGDTAKGPNEANPYEIPVGSGGRLGAPKGKTGGESDTALDAAASSAFKDDFKGGDLAGNGDGADMAAGSEEDPGYTIFKMVKYRYAELKKKGNI